MHANFRYMSLRDNLMRIKASVVRTDRQKPCTHGLWVRRGIMEQGLRYFLSATLQSPRHHGCCTLQSEFGFELFKKETIKMGPVSKSILQLTPQAFDIVHDGIPRIARAPRCSQRDGPTMGAGTRNGGAS